MASPAPPSMRIRFGAFELDATSGELRKNGILLKLQPQPFRVLLLLIERAGQVVTREEIQRCLWTDSTFVDFEHGINFSINQIRGALADSAENPRYVETIPRRGYRFIGEVDQPPAGSTNIVEVSNVHRFKFIAGAVLVLILIAAVSYGVYSLFSGKRGAPFENFTIAQVTNTGDVAAAAISPDGKYLLIVADSNGKQSLWLRNVPTKSDTQVIAPADVSYGSPTFSPDGNYIYFLKALNPAQTRFNLLRSPVLGGTPQVVVRDLGSGITFAPDGKRIAYVRRNDPEVGKFRLLTANTDGTEEKMLGDGLGPEAIAWSPDGKLIASTITRVSDALSVIQLQNVASTTVWTLARFNDLYLADLVWLPDGGGLLTTYQDRKTGSPRVQVGIVSQPGGYFRPITNDTNTYDTLTLAADGRTLAAVQERYTQTLYVFPSTGFQGGTPAPAPAQNKDSFLVGWASNGDLYFDGPDLQRISADGHVRTTLINDRTARIYRPTDCQGGRYVVFAWADHHGSKKINLWRVDADGSNPKQLTDGTRDMAPQCSPDGKWVYFYNHTTAQMMRVGIDGGLPEIVPGTSLPGLTLPISWPLFGIARDGKTLTFLAAKSESGFVTQIIALVHLNSTSTPTTRLLVPDQRISGWPQFTPGGTAVVYPVHSGADNLWLQPLDGSVGRQITNFQSDAIVMFEFSPDGKTLAVMRSHSESDAVLLYDTSSR